MTASLSYTITDRAATGGGWDFFLANKDGVVLHQSHGDTRATAFQGLLNYGFVVIDTQGQPVVRVS